MKQGYITVFFSIIMAVCLSLLVGLLYGARENAIRAKAAEAMETAGISAFAEYDINLWNRYGLLYVDAGYKSKIDNFIIPEEHARQCMNKNFDEMRIKLLGGVDLYKLSCTAVETKGIRFASDMAGAGIRRQACKIMEYEYGLAYAEALYNAVTQNSNDSFSEDDFSEELTDAINSVQNKDSKKKPVMTEWLDSAKEMLADCNEKESRLVKKVTRKDISEAAVNEDLLLSNRKLNCGNIPIKDSGGIKEYVLFRAYLNRYCGCFVSQNSDSLLKYETEYLIQGKPSDVENLNAIARKLLLIRLSINLSKAYADKKLQGEIKAVVLAITTFLGIPESTDTLMFIINLVMGYRTSINDLKNLFNGKDVDKSADDTDSSKMTYRDYLNVFMYATDTKKLTERFMNLCEMNIRNISQNLDFRLDNCFDAWEFTAFFASEYGYTYTATRKYDIE